MSKIQSNHYYIYAWYYKNTGEIFYIGKGSYERWKDVVTHRNDYFKNIISKEKDNVDVKKLFENLYEDESWELERKLIHEYWERGECKANFHEGGRGGNHGNYGENMRKKLSEFASTRTGSKNPMWKHKYTEEQIKNLSEGQKRRNWHPSKEHLQKMIEGSKKACQTPEFRQKMSQIKKGTKLSERQINILCESHWNNNYDIYLNEEKIFSTYKDIELRKFCKEKFNISRTIVEKLINNEWKPTFSKHQHLKTLQIIKTKRDKGVSTTPDECKEVE